MKKRLMLILSIVAIVIVAIWISFNALTNESRDWNFIQSIGGIRIEKPLETENGFYLPIICNVSGQDSVTIKPEGPNSALFCLRTKTTVEENKIYVTVITGYNLFGELDSKCKAVRLGKLKKQTYTVYYKDNKSDEHLIGEFTIE